MRVLYNTNRREICGELKCLTKPEKQGEYKILVYIHQSIFTAVGVAVESVPDFQEHYSRFPLHWFS